MVSFFRTEKKNKLIPDIKLSKDKKKVLLPSLNDHIIACPSLSPVRTCFPSSLIATAVIDCSCSTSTLKNNIVHFF